MPSLGVRQLGLEHAVGAAAQVDRHKAQRLVHRHVAVRGPHDAGPIAQGLVKGLAQTNRDVLGRVVLVDVQVAASLHAQVKQTMAGKQGQHVVIETDTGVDLGLSAAVDL